MNTNEKSESPSKSNKLMKGSSTKETAVGPIDKTFSNVVSEDTLPRNDSCSEFGKMETINLLQTDSDSQSQLAVVSDNLSEVVVKIEENLNDAKASGASDLSQYFKPACDSSGQDIFTNIKNPQTCPIEVQRDQQIKAIVNEEPLAKSETESPQNQPSLTKLFADEKGGHDTDGKAFFDKLSGKTSCLADPAYQLGNGQECAILLTSPGDISFLGSGDTEDDIYNAWIQSDVTRQVLVSLVTSIPGTFYPNKEHLTRPAVIIEEEMGDPVRTLLHEVASPLASQRKVFSAGDVLQNEDGLKQLIEHGCFHAAINLTTRLLKAGYGIFDKCHLGPKTLQIWFTRIALLVKLKKFSLAEVEAEAFGNLDKPDLYYEFYPDVYPNKKGSMVPFSFRLLLAELPQYQGNHQIALNNLYSLLHIIQKIIANVERSCMEDGTMVEIPEVRKKASLSVWKGREIKVLYSVLNCVLSQKDYIMAISVANILMEKDKTKLMQLYSAVGRIYLQLGDMKQAQYYFELVGAQAEKSDDESLQLERLINSALLAVAYSDNEEACKFYEKGLALKPNDPMLVNNMAVCLLYMGRLKASLTLLEQTIQANPSACLHEGILFNICTLYELESSHCTLKKHAMLDLVAKYVGDGFNVSCLKIPPVK